MTNPQSDPPQRASGRTARGGRAALVALAVLTAVCSAALLTRTKSPDTPSAAVAQSHVAMDVTQAAAYAATSSNTVEIKNYAFAPAAVTVPVGTTVTWVNEDTVPHTVTSKAGPAKFDSGQLASGGSWSATFATPGTYDYYCADHPQMVARITVTGPSSGGSTPAPPPSTTPTTGSSGPASTPSTPSVPPSSHPSSHPTPPSSSSATAPSSSSAAPSGSPTATAPSSSMSMPAPSGGSGGQCGLPAALGMLIQHIDTAHLGESPGQQVQDLLNLDQYVLSHTTLVANLLGPAEGVLLGTC